MIKILLKGTEWSQLLDYVSPTFFDVVPAGQLLNAGKGLAKRFYDVGLRESTFQSRSLEFQNSGIPVSLAQNSKSKSKSKTKSSTGDLTDSQKQEMGSALLRIYFHQIFNPGCLILDLRSQVFGITSDTEGTSAISWSPSGLLADFQPEFRAALCDIYRGYYFDDNNMFESGLDQLKLKPAKETFLKHFDVGQQDAVSFKIKNFMTDFHDIFILCQAQKILLHKDFVQLGIYLAFLYQHLETFGRPQDVRKAFFQVVK